jgi:hypothetical protein
LEILEKHDPQQKNYVITCDTCWIYWDNYHRGQWTIDRAAIFARIHATISSKKTMISAYFIRQGFISIEALPETEWSNSALFTEIILPNLVQSVSLLRPKMQTQCYWLYIDNVKSHNSALSLSKTEELRFTRLPQPPYSPDLTPCDLFLLGYLKKELQEMNFRFQNEVISAMTTILSEIPVRTLSEVFDQWIEKLYVCTINGREYV